MDKDFVLEYALDIGEQMVICGAEISRVEDTIERICRAYGAERIDVFSITSCIIATLKMEGEPPAHTLQQHRLYQAGQAERAQPPHMRKQARSGRTAARIQANRAI